MDKQRFTCIMHDGYIPYVSNEKSKYGLNLIEYHVKFREYEVEIYQLFTDKLVCVMEKFLFDKWFVTREQYNIIQENKIKSYGEWIDSKVICIKDRGIFEKGKNYIASYFENLEDVTLYSSKGTHFGTVDIKLFKEIFYDIAKQRNEKIMDILNG